MNRLFNAFAIGEEKEPKEKKMKISVQEELDKGGIIFAESYLKV